MNILVVTSSFPRFEADSSGKFVREHTNLLENAGHTVRILTWADSSRTVKDPRVESIRYAPGRYQKLFFQAGAPENLRDHPWLYALVPMALLAMFAAILRHMSWADLVIGHWIVPAGLLARLAGRLTRTPSLIVGHSGGVHAVASLPYPLNSRVARSLDGPLTVPSRALARKWQKLGGRATVLPMGIPTEIPNVAPLYEIPRRNKDWLVLSRLVPIKGLGLVLEAFAKAGLSDATLHIAGDGPERARLQARAEALDASIQFHGWVTGAAKADLMRRCRFFVLASRPLHGRFEGLPTALLEAQHAGLIPLVSDSPGLEEAVFDTDLIVSGRCVDYWSARMRALHENSPAPDLAAEFAQAFTWPNLRASWLDRIESAVKESRR